MRHAFETLRPATLQAFFSQTPFLQLVARHGEDPDIHGEWMGFLKLSEMGAAWVREHLQALAQRPEELRGKNLIDLLQALLDDGQQVRVIYTTGSWLDVDTLEDLSLGGEYP